MPLVTDAALVLQTFPYSETSKVLRLFTRGHGVQSALARGALRPKSRFGGLLEPFTEGTATLYVKEGRELHTLSGFELVRSGQALGRDLVRFGGASLLVELVLRTASAEPEPAVFDQLRAALRSLEAAPPGQVEAEVIARTWELVGQLGFAPTLEECLVCGRPLEPDEATVFDYAAGGTLCAECGAGRGGRALPAEARAALLELTRGRAVPLGRAAAHWRLLERYLAHHVAEGSGIRSLAFLAEALESA